MATVTGGNKLSQRLTEMANALGSGAAVDVGFLENATYPDGKPVAMIAAIQEFGAPSRNIPPRPFFRTMIAAHAKEWPKLIAKQLPVNGYKVQPTLAQLGTEVQGELQQSIRDLTSPALSPITVMLRGMRSQKRYKNMKFGALISEARTRVDAGKTNYGASTKPLIDTGQMIRAVDYRVRT